MGHRDIRPRQAGFTPAGASVLTRAPIATRPPAPASTTTRFSSVTPGAPTATGSDQVAPPSRDQTRYGSRSVDTHTP